MISSHHAAAQIKNGQVVAYPTESFYALGADATNPKAIRKLFQLKKRDPRKPIALIAADIPQVQKFFYVSSAELKLAEKHWPGPLTLLLQPKVPMTNPVAEDDERYIASQALGVKPPKKPSQDRGIIGGLIDSFTSGTLPQPILIGVRVPSHAGARNLAKLAGIPLTATSANISGHQPTKQERTVKKNFPRIGVLVGSCGKQTKSSTVLEVIDTKLRVHRSGAVKIA